MSYAFGYYLLTMLCNLSMSVHSLMVASIILMVIILITMAICHIEDTTFEVKHLFKPMAKVTSALIVLNILIPSKKDALIITGLWVGQESIEETIKLPPKLMSLLNKELDELLKEFDLKTENNTESKENQ